LRPRLGRELPFCCHDSPAMSASYENPTGCDMARFNRRMHPGRVLRGESMEPMRLDATGLAQALGVAPGQIAPVLDDQQPMTSDLALRLARCFRTSPQFWLGLQTAYDLSMAHAPSGAEIEARCQPSAVLF